jgi:hypothetical protein
MTLKEKVEVALFGSAVAVALPAVIALSHAIGG